ncbi:unnamed protein product [Prunus brigantina]
MISISDTQDRQVRISTSLSSSLQTDFMTFLRANSEVFTWPYNDMPGISPDIISHKLSISPSFKPSDHRRAPLLSTPLLGEDLIIYLSVSASTLSSVLIRRPNGIELPIFYMSHALLDAEQWYHPRPSEKGQAVADFISEFTLPIHPVMTPPSASADSPSTDGAFDHTSPHWTLCMDGSSSRKGSGTGLVLKTPDDTMIEYAIRFQFRASNNEAEYEALLAGLRLAHSTGAERLMICSDSQLVVNQVITEFAAKDESMTAYLAQTRRLLSQFKTYYIRQIPRSENSHADALSRLASAIENRVGRHVPIEILARRSTAEAGVNTVRQDPSWMDSIHAHLTDGTLPADRVEARAVRRRSTRYLLLKDILYRRSYSLPLLRCVTPQ